MNKGIKAFRIIFLVAILLVTFLVSNTLFYACSPNQTNNSDFLEVVKEYADAMISQGRDVYGYEHSPLFASALNRNTMKLGTKQEFGSIDGVRESDRSLGGANLLEDQDLIQILYLLTDLTGDKSYANEADKALEYFWTHCQSPATGLMCWGEHLYWDFNNEACGHAANYDIHEAEVWPFWDQTYRMAPKASWKFAFGLWDDQIADKTTGDFSRHAKYWEHGPQTGFDFPRYAGQMIEVWADAYNREENANQPRRDELLTAIKVLFERMEQNMMLTKSGYLPAGRAESGDHIDVVWMSSNLELARCLWKAAPTMNNDTAGRMKKFAIKQDIDFLNAPHRLDSVGGGFAVTLHAETGEPRVRSMNKPYTSTWSSGYGYGTHAGIANKSFGRYRTLNSGYPDLADSYKNLMIRAAEKYLNSGPDTTLLLKPEEFSDAIEFMLNCYELTGSQKYLDRATYFGQLGIDLFIHDDHPLPKATNKHKHYESITGGPSFIYQLLKIYMTIKN